MSDMSARETMRALVDGKVIRLDGTYRRLGKEGGLEFSKSPEGPWEPAYDTSFERAAVLEGMN